MAKCFLITGGGTGAKVAEAFVHLCAAGCGPEEAHLLLIDADTDNGNVARATDTVSIYNKVRPWGWKVQPGNGRSLEFFSTALHAYFLTQPVKDVIGGSLSESVAADDTLREVLDLLYDEEEQGSDNQFGFLARPNLGSLILAEHLEQQLRTAEKGISFVRALRSALKSEDTVCVMVAGSIFGGTGASLLPVARNCLLNVLDLEQDDQNRLQFAAIMMLPYFSPRSKVATVDPDRFLLDTSLALQYYGVSQRSVESSYDRIYLIGSDNPQRVSHQLQNPVSGGKKQTNPAFVEEWIAALAVQHFMECGTRLRSDAERVILFDTKHESLTWENLPYRCTHGPVDVTEQITILLHLAAFFLRPKRKVTGGLSGGLHWLLTQVDGRQIEFFSWFDTLLDAWGKEHYAPYRKIATNGNSERWDTLNKQVGENSANKLSGDLGEYFTRLLGWAFHALQTLDMELVEAPTGTEATKDYARLHSGMCDVRPKAIDQDGPTAHYRDDNPVARLVRAAMVALVLDRENDYTGKAGGDRIELRRQKANVPRAVVPYIEPDELKATATSLQRSSAYSAYFKQ